MTGHEVADRRNASYRRWLMTELGEIELCVPRTRSFSALSVVRAQGHEPWTKPVLPEPYRLMADINARFGQQIFYLPQRQRIADVHHHREADFCRRAVKIAERIFHRMSLRIADARLKPSYSDNATIATEYSAFAGQFGLL